MLPKLFTTFAIASTLFCACKSNHLNGVYVCDQAGKKADTVVQQLGSKELVLDMTCTITQFEFKGKNTVLVSGVIGSSYVMDEDVIRIKGTGSEIVLTIKDENTLTGEGIAAGTYRKK